MMEPLPDDEAWFAPKAYGYGSGLPIRWQGWATLALFLFVVVLVMTCLRGWTRDLGMGVSMAVLFAVCALRTRGGWRWRWGDRRP